jgi:hypothetical protein
MHWTVLWAQGKGSKVDVIVLLIVATKSIYFLFLMLAI